MVNTPILFIVFNRPDVTGIVFDEIRKAQPRQLFIAADGPRTNRPADFELCKETRAIVSQIDWPCEVKTLFREQNLGCGKAVSSAITWFFDQVEEGIILEDDCLPHPDFFIYCQDLLEKYRDNPKVMHIGGVNFQNGNKRGEGSYYFSAVSHVWGWASWRRAWKQYNFNISDFYTFVREEKIYNYFSNEILALHWLDTFKSMYNHAIDTWDHQWSYAILNKGGVSIVPNVNMITNIGFGENATHTNSANSVFARLKKYPIAFPLKHPQIVEIDKVADYYFFNDVDQMPLEPTSLFSSLVSNLKSIIACGIEYSLRRFVFIPKIKSPGKNVLIQKIDAIGDYVITRNFFEELIRSEKYRGYTFYLLANIRLKSFIEETDKKWFKEVIYFNEKDLAKIKTKYPFYFKLRGLKLETIIHATFSRSMVTDDIIFHAGAPINIGFLGDTANVAKVNKPVIDRYYSQLIDVNVITGNICTHEFEKQKVFFETIIGRSISLQGPSLTDIIKPAKENTICICPGSNEDYKKWNTGYFSELITLIEKKYPIYKFQIICGPGENLLGDQIISDLTSVGLSQKVELINTQSILHLITCISRSSIVIANDSAPIHIAAAFVINNVCVFNGSRYGRFVPYPSSITNVTSVVVPDSLVKSLNPSTKEHYYSHLTHLDIDKVTVKAVFDEVIKKLN